MPESEAQDIVKAVQSKLEARLSSGTDYRVTVGSAEEVWRSDDVWNVPVHPDRDPPRSTNYYDLLSEVEEELEADRLHVFLVPSGIQSNQEDKGDAPPAAGVM